MGTQSHKKKDLAYTVKIIFGTFTIYIAKFTKIETLNLKFFILLYLTATDDYHTLFFILFTLDLLLLHL